MIKPLGRKTFLVLLLLLIAFTLRMYKVEALNTADADERLWLMVGVSLIKEGVPTAWTIGWAQHRWDKYWYAENGVVTPWLDHPPLFALFVGGWSLLMDEADISINNQAALRFPMVLLSVATIFVTWLLTKELFNAQLAVFVVAIYTFFPTDLVASRFILAEHTIPFLLVLGMYSFVKYSRENDKRRRLMWVMVMSMVCVASPLMKLSGGVVPMSLVLLSFLRRKYDVGCWLSLMGALSLMIYFGYAWSYGWDIFIGAQTAHVERPQSFGHFWSFFTKLSAGNVIMLDPTVIIGWIGLLVILSKGKKLLAQQIIFSSLLSISYMFLYIASIENYDWYKYPAYPFLAMGAGYVVWQLWRGEYLYLVFFLPLLAMMLENSGLVVDQAERRLFMTLIYFLSVMSVVFNKYLFNLKRMVYFFLLMLFLFETVWYLRILGVPIQTIKEFIGAA